MSKRLKGRPGGRNLPWRISGEGDQITIENSIGEVVADIGSEDDCGGRTAALADARLIIKAVNEFTKIRKPRKPKRAEPCI